MPHIATHEEHLPLHTQLGEQAEAAEDQALCLHEDIGHDHNQDFAYDDELMMAMMKTLAVTDSLKHMTVELVPAITFKAAASLFFAVFHQHAVNVLYKYS